MWQGADLVVSVMTLINIACLAAAGAGRLYTSRECRAEMSGSVPPTVGVPRRTAADSRTRQPSAGGQSSKSSVLAAGRQISQPSVLAAGGQISQPSVLAAGRQKPIPPTGVHNRNSSATRRRTDVKDPPRADLFCGRMPQRAKKAEI